MAETIEPALEAALLPCPFCGEQPEWCKGAHGDGSLWEYLACAQCEAMGPAEGHGDNRAAKIAAWNRRALPQAEIDRLRDALRPFAAWIEPCSDCVGNWKFGVAPTSEDYVRAYELLRPETPNGDRNG